MDCMANVTDPQTPPPRTCPTFMSAPSGRPRGQDLWRPQREKSMTLPEAPCCQGKEYSCPRHLRMAGIFLMLTALKMTCSRRRLPSLDALVASILQMENNMAPWSNIYQTLHGI